MQKGRGKMAIRKGKKLNPEMEQKKEEFLEKINPALPAPKKTEGPPIYLLAMLLILGILIGIAAFKMLYPPAPPAPIGNDTNSQNDLAYKTVPITMVYSSQCKTCRQTNTIEELFRVRQIPYSPTKVDADSNEGKVIVERFGIEKVPTAIIDATKLEFYPTTKADFVNAFRVQNGAYVVGEENLDDGAYYPSYFLGSMEGFCDANRPTVVQFDDFYNLVNTQNRKGLYSFMNDFNNYIDIKYSYTQTAASQDDNSVLGNLFLMCASEQGKYQELERAMAGIYCNNPFKGDPTALTEVEIRGCASISDHFAKPLSQFELDIAVKRAGLDLNTFKTCYGNRQQHYSNARGIVEELGIRRIGTFLADCRVTSDLPSLSATVCAMHPEIAPCSPADTNAAK